MAKRLTLLYRFSTDNGATWTDFTEQVDSLQTTITDNLCTNNFTSAKDEAQFTMPETPLFDGQGNPTPKKMLMDALLGTDDILIHINAPFPKRKVVWDDNDVLWNGSHVVWSGTERRFTGYADRSSIDLRSFPLPPSLTVKVQDVSTLNLDEKVGIHICWEDYTVKQIVRSLLSLAGYSPMDPSLSDSDTTVMSATDNVSLEAFVIDKDNAKSYREYIDTLLFEAGGYVINFDEYGKPILVHLQWNGNAPAQRVIDNPMNSSGVAMRSSYMKEDGAKLTWSTLEWSAPGQRLWQSGISQKVENGQLIGEKVQAGRYWPDGGELTPQYFQYDAKLLDSAYLTRESRLQNEDLTIIMAKDIYARTDSMRNGEVFNGWDNPIPTSPTDFTQEPYNLTTNPTIWPTKAWWLLHNPTADDVNLTFFTIYGTVLYRKKRNTLQTRDSKNPKSYESQYIYNEAQARRFLAFWWHFIQTSRYLFTWTDLNQYDGLNDIVQVGVKGNGTMQKALVVGKTSKWINNDHEIVTFNAVGIETYIAQSFVPATIAPSSAIPAMQTVKSAIRAVFVSVPSKTLSEWEALGTPGAVQTWAVTNSATFKAGDVALINGTISDLNGTPVTLFIDVTSVDTVVGTISGTGIRIQYAGGEGWDFDMSQYTVSINRRMPTSYVDITLSSKTNGQGGITPYWTCNGSHTHFTPGAMQYASGDVVILRVWLDETLSGITVTMYESSQLDNPVVKTLTIADVTEYDHDFGTISALPLPEYIDSPADTMEVIRGDFFVAGADFDVYTKGVPYMYDGNSSWTAMTATADNSQRMLRAMGTVLSDPSIQPSVGALYGWFQNLVALNAVFQNLYARNVQVGDGDGTEGSGFRFRAQEYNEAGQKLASPNFDVYYGNKMLFSVTAEGRIYFGSGFWYDPEEGGGSIHSSGDGVIINSSGNLSAQSATFDGISIDNTNGGSADFGSAVFSQGARSSSSVTVGSTQQALTIYNKVVAVYGQPSANTFSQWFECSLSGNSNVKYVRVQMYYSTYHGSIIAQIATAQFADSGMSLISNLTCVHYVVGSASNSNPLANGASVTMYYGGNIMKFLNLPTSSAGLESGRIWADTSNGYVLKVVP